MPNENKPVFDLQVAAGCENCRAQTFRVCPEICDDNTKRRLLVVCTKCDQVLCVILSHSKPSPDQIVKTDLPSMAM